MPDQPYAQTDVWHDRSWLMANLVSGNHRMRQAAEQALHQLNIDEANQQRNDVLGQRQDAIDQHQANFEANQRRIMAHTGSLELDRQLKMDRDTEIDEQGHGLLTGMMKLDAGLRRGEITKSQYDDGLLGLGQQYPLGLRHPEAARHYDFAITEADKQNAFNARREYTQAAKIGAKYGIAPQIDPETGIASVAHTQLAALQTPKGRNEALGNLNTEMARKYGITTGVSSLFNPVAPHTSPDEGQTIDLPFVDHTGQISKLNVPMDRFNQMKADFNDRYFALNPQTQAQPAGAVQTGAQPNATPAAIPTIGSQQDYEALPAGSHFISNGQRFMKPDQQLNQGYTQKVNFVGGGVPATWSPTGQQFPQPAAIVDPNSPKVPVAPLDQPTGQ